MGANEGFLSEVGEYREGDSDYSKRTLILRLMGNERDVWEKNFEELKVILGESVHRSDHPAMQKLNPFLTFMIVIFPSESSS